MAWSVRDVGSPSALAEILLAPPVAAHRPMVADGGPAVPEPGGSALRPAPLGRRGGHLGHPAVPGLGLWRR